jgi:hypothetical protein
VGVLWLKESSWSGDGACWEHGVVLAVIGTALVSYKSPIEAREDCRGAQEV